MPPFAHLIPTPFPSSLSCSVMPEALWVHAERKLPQKLSSYGFLFLESGPRDVLLAANAFPCNSPMLDLPNGVPPSAGAPSSNRQRVAR